MSDDMTTKYQQHYNQVLTGTLTDTIMKSISYQANIKLANEIIAEQEKTITDLNGQLETVKRDLETFKNSDTAKINSLENVLKNQSDTINKLNNEISNANRLKNEIENLKSQTNNVEIFRKELLKEREEHSLTKENYEIKIKELNAQIELLNVPPKKKKISKKYDVLEMMNSIEEFDDEQIIDEEKETAKDGGIF